jgi:hypothetical protein
MIMEGIEEVSITSRWSHMHLIVFLLLMCGGNAHVPVATIEKGFIPSLAWLEGNPNMTVVQKEAQ